MSSLAVTGDTQAPAYSADNETAYRGLVKMHAQELVRSGHFIRTDRMRPQDVRSIARDLEALGRAGELDATCGLVLAEADALQLRQEADAQYRARLATANEANWIDAQLRARRPCR